VSAKAGKEGKQPTRVPFTIRFEKSLLAELAADAAARHQPLGPYIVDRLMRRQEPPHPALAALGLMIEAVEQLRRHPDAAGAAVEKLEHLVVMLCAVAREELQHDR
jgi:hypothetical protein